MKADVESEKNRVTLDARMLGFTGIGSYVGGLLRSVASVASEFGFTVICSTHHAPLDLLSTRFRLVESSAPIYSLREQWQIPRLLDGTDLLHCPHYNVPYFYRGRLVVTIHDLTHLVHRESLPNWLAYPYARLMLAAAVKQATRIITVSEFSKQSIQDQLGVPAEKIRVIYNGLPEPFISEPKEPEPGALRRMGVASPFILFVGRLTPHKNVGALIRSFARLPADRRNGTQLVIAGKKDSDYPRLELLVSDLRLGDRVVFTGHIPRVDLVALYAGAKVFALVSLNEGFGLPALEAMAYGVPVVASNNSSLPEVVGDAGLLVDPRDENAIVNALERVLSEPSLSQRLGKLGRERAQLFSAREAAQEHLKVYREALSA
jgi:glycosyltransferase involved in cell wall biosynthesis